MAKTLTGSIRLDVAANFLNAIDLSEASFPFRLNQLYTFTDGTGANQIKSMFTDQRTLSASATEDLDLAGSLTDVYGATITFTKVKLLMVRAASGNTNDVLVGGAGSNGFTSWVGDATDVVKVKPGGSLILVAPDATGYAVTAGTGDLLTITNSAGSTSVTYDIVILGVV